MKREKSWDFLKTLLMFFIVFGHICPSDPDKWTPITRIIGLFAIPLFFFISGYFQSKVDSFKALIERYKKNFFRIVIPMLSWGLIYVIISAIIQFPCGANLCSSDIWQFFKYSPFYIMGIFWFLTALIFCQIIGSILSLIIWRNKMFGIILLIVSFPLFCLFSPTLLEHYHFSFVWFFYGLGMIYKQTNKDLLYYSYNIFILICLASITIIIVGFGMQLMPNDTFYYRSNLVIETPISFIIQRFTVYLSVSILMLFWLLYIYKMFADKYIVKLLASWGVDTLFIYCSHVMILVFIYRPYILPYLLHDDCSIDKSLEGHVVGLLLSIVLYWGLQTVCSLCKRFKWVKMLLMGGK